MKELAKIDQLKSQLALAQAKSNLPSKEQEAFANMISSGFIAQDEFGNYGPGPASNATQG